jgi:hypothetical protein
LTTLTLDPALRRDEIAAEQRQAKTFAWVGERSTELCGGKVRV